MTPTDASNLLLALMYDEELANCPESVSSLRSAQFQGGWKQEYGKLPESTREVPPHHFLQAEGTPFQLGDVLDTMIDWYVRSGSVEEYPDNEDDEVDWPRYATNISFSVSRPWHRCKLHLDAFNTLWDIDYRWVSPAEVAYEEALPKDESRRFVTRFDALRGTCMTSTRVIGDDEFSGLADILRGETFDWDKQEFYVPSYDAYPHWHYGDDGHSIGSATEGQGVP